MVEKLEKIVGNLVSLSKGGDANRYRIDMSIIDKDNKIYLVYLESSNTQSLRTLYKFLEEKKAHGITKISVPVKRVKEEDTCIYEGKGPIEILEEKTYIC